MCGPVIGRDIIEREGRFSPKLDYCETDRTNQGNSLFSIIGLAIAHLPEPFASISLSSPQVDGLWPPW
jgi:hypothetical protein